MGAQVIGAATEVSELGAALVATMAERKQSLTDVTRETNMAYETLIGIQAVRTRIRRPTIDKVAEYLGWTVEQVAEAAQRPSQSALVTQNGVQFPVRQSESEKDLGTRNCRACRDRARCRAVVSAGGLALCEEVIDVDRFDLPPARRFPISDLIGAPEKPIDHRQEALSQVGAPGVIEEKPTKPILPSLGLSLTVLEMMIGKAQEAAEEKTVRDWVAAAQMWIPTVHQASGTSE